MTDVREKIKQIKEKWIDSDNISGNISINLSNRTPSLNFNKLEDV